jgi:hypothetical protein
MPHLNFLQQNKKDKINRFCLFCFGFLMRASDRGTWANNNTSRQADRGQSCIQKVSDVADIGCLLGCI